MNKDPFPKELEDEGAYCGVVCEQKFMKKWAFAIYIIAIVAGLGATIYGFGNYNGKMSQRMDSNEVRINNMEKMVNMYNDKQDTIISKQNKILSKLGG